MVRVVAENLLAETRKAENSTDAIAVFDLDGLPAGLAPSGTLRLSALDVEGWSGGFAFAIHDRVSGALHAFRDHMGARPLYWQASPARVLLSSSLPRLVARAEPAPEPDETSVREFLASGMPGDDRTIYRGIRRLPAASRLVVDRNGSRVERYWSPFVEAWRGDGGERAMDAEFRERFRVAVEAALADGPGAGILLSGGADSGAVLGMAARAATPRVALTAVSERGAEWDESEAARQAAEHHGVRWHPVPAESIHPLDGIEDILARVGEPPAVPNLALHARLLAAAREEGCDRVLDGHDADVWFMPSSASLGRLLLRGRAIEWLRTASGLRRDCGLAWGHLLRASVRAAVRESRRRGWGAFHWDEGALLEAEANRCLAPAPGAALESARALQRLEGVDERHPFFDPSLIRFLASVPLSSRTRGGRMKILLHRALSDLLPPAARTRRRKPSYVGYLDQSLREHARRDIERLANDGSRHLERFWDRRLGSVELRGFLKGDGGSRMRVWWLLVFERWCMLRTGRGDGTIQGGTHHESSPNSRSAFTRRSDSAAIGS